jgi:hypothetical protein
MANQENIGGSPRGKIRLKTQLLLSIPVTWHLILNSPWGIRVGLFQWFERRECDEHWEDVSLDSGEVLHSVRGKTWQDRTSDCSETAFFAPKSILQLLQVTLVASWWLLSVSFWWENDKRYVSKLSPWHIWAYRKSGVTLNQKHIFRGKWARKFTLICYVWWVNHMFTIKLTKLLVNSHVTDQYMVFSWLNTIKITANHGICNHVLICNH